MRSALFLALSASAAAQSLTSALAGNANLTSLVSLLASYPDVTTALAGASNITLLAPSNGAIQALMGSMNASSTGSVANLLQYHVLTGNHPRSSFSGNSTFVPTLLTDSAVTNVTGGQRVEGLIANGRLTFISGNIDNTTVSTEDIRFDGGVIHIIDRVLTIPPQLGARALSNAGVTVSEFYSLLRSSGQLSQLSALKDATFFVPSDTPISRVASVVGGLSQEQVADVIRYHVVQESGPYYSTRIPAGNSTLKTLQGSDVTVTSRRANGVTTVYVNGARVVASNWLIGGGVIHVIDNVLSPSNRSTLLPVTANLAATGAAGSENGTSSGGAAGGSSTGTARSGASSNKAMGAFGGLAVVAALVFAL